MSANTENWVDDHIQFVIDALAEHADLLELAPTG